MVCKGHEINAFALAIHAIDTPALHWTSLSNRKRYCLFLLVCGLLALLLTGCGLTDAEVRYNSGVEAYSLRVS